MQYMVKLYPKKLTDVIDSNEPQKLDEQHQTTWMEVCENGLVDLINPMV